jgi:hypothetical protein
MIGRFWILNDFFATLREAPRDILMHLIQWRGLPQSRKAAKKSDS